MSAPLIDVRGLVKVYGGRAVLNGVDLAIDRGETVAVIGGSGSGKTTLARIVVGLEPPTSGRVVVAGIDMSDADAFERSRGRFGVVFQRSALLDSMTVFDNVAFPLREETKLDEDTIRERVRMCLRELDVEAAARKMPSELSGGMAKRVAIARAIVTEPEIIVYDEPTSGLDPITSRVVDGLIERVRERFFVTSLVITHDMVTAFEIADRVALLAGGRIVMDGAPEVVFRSHGADIEPFAASSGVDLEHLAPRRDRKTPAEIRARWAATHPRRTQDARPWYARWARARA